MFGNTKILQKKNDCPLNCIWTFTLFFHSKKKKKKKMEGGIEFTGMRLFFKVRVLKRG